MLLSTSFNRDIDGLAALEAIPLTFTNGDFETGDATGWTVDRGTMTVTGSRNSTTPDDGSFFGAANGAATTDLRDAFTAHTDLDPVSDGASTTFIDAGSYKLTLDWLRANDDTLSDIGTVFVRFLDGSSNQLGPDVGAAATTAAVSSTWEGRQTEVAVPPSTRTIRVYLIGQLRGGSIVNVAWDAFEAVLSANDLVPDNRTRATVVFRNTTGSLPAYLNEALGVTPSITDMNDQDGSATGWSLATQAGQFASPAADTGAMPHSRIHPATLSSGVSSTDTTNTSITLRIGGLNTGTTYDLRVFCSRDNTSGIETARNTDVDVGGPATLVNAKCNSSQLVGFSGVSPDGSGNIDLTIATVVSFGHVASFDIAEN